jgi:hypothetical protein
MDRPEIADAREADKQENQAADNLRQGVFQPENRTGDSTAKATAGPERDNRVGGMAEIDFDKFPLRGFAKLDIEKESGAIADLFDYSKGNKKYGEAVKEGTQCLSSDLKSLSGNISEYNKLLQGVAEKIPDEPAANPNLVLSNFNKSTGTWNNVSILAYGDQGYPTAAYRIVQPGNTLSQLAREEKETLAPSQTTAEYVKYLQAINNIADPDKLVVGQAIRMRKV